jgi:hypothetical protein
MVLSFFIEWIPQLQFHYLSIRTYFEGPSKLKDYILMLLSSRESTLFSTFIEILSPQINDMTKTL